MAMNRQVSHSGSSGCIVQTKFAYVVCMAYNIALHWLSPARTFITATRVRAYNRGKKKTDFTSYHTFSVIRMHSRTRARVRQLIVSFSFSRRQDKERMEKKEKKQEVEARRRIKRNGSMYNGTILINDYLLLLLPSSLARSLLARVRSTLTLITNWY